MKYVVRPNFFQLFNQLESHNRRRYTYAEIGDALGTTRQAARQMMIAEPDDSGFIRYGTASKLLDFFASEGMPIQIQDLFTVTPTDDPEEG